MNNIGGDLRKKQRQSERKRRKKPDRERPGKRQQ